MKFSLILILMVTVSDSYGELEAKQRENYCYDSVAGFIEVGQRMPPVPGECLETICAETDGTSSMTCPTFIPGPGSKCKTFPKDYSKSYPDCCEKVSCEE